MPVRANPVIEPEPAAAPPAAAARTWQPKSVTWTSAAGVSVNLSDRGGGYSGQAGRAGFGPVDAQVISDTMWDGSALVRTHRTQPRVMTIPLLVEGPDQETYLERLNALQATFRHPADPATGLPAAGRITVSLPDGSQRSIGAYYQGGGSLTEDPVDDVAAHWGMLPNLQFYAPVPTWEGEIIAQEWQLAASGAGIPPMPPVTLSSSSVLGTTQVINPGDADAYPVWTITGPGTPTITNSDTGQSYAFTSAIPAGTVVTVDCRPVELAPATGLTAVDGSGTDWWPLLADYPDFWPLPPGTSDISLSMPGSTAASSVALSAASRWLGAW